MQAFIKFVVDETAACIIAPVIYCDSECIVVFFDLKLYILFIVAETELSIILISDDISAVNWLVAHAHFLILEILEIFLLMNFAAIFIHAEGV